jgi:hypothetical protein
MPVIDQIAQAVGLILGLLNGLFIISLGMGWLNDHRQEKSKLHAVEASDEFDVEAFLRHLKKGTFVDVQRVMESGELLDPQTLMLNSVNDVVLASLSSRGSNKNRSPQATAPTPAYSVPLFHLKSAQVMGDDGEETVHITFEGKTLILKCKAEDDAVYIAGGFCNLAKKLSSDSHFCEELLSAPTVTPSESGTLDTITSAATTIFMVPVMPIYAALHAMESTPKKSSE